MEKREILVVEDETGIRDIFEEVLSKAGYVVVSAGSAEAALKILKQKNIHVMFLDIKLPGMNGMGLCREIRKHNHVAIIFAMTGHVGLFELSDCREAGFDDYFAKPINVEFILKVACDAFEKLERWAKEGSLLLPILK